MKFAKSLALGAGVLALAMGSAYAAASGSKDNDPGFNALDTNHDGQLSRSEAAGNPDLSKAFTAADKNQDGKLSRIEYLTVMTKKDFAAVKDKVSNAFSSKK